MPLRMNLIKQSIVLSNDLDCWLTVAQSSTRRSLACGVSMRSVVMTAGRLDNFDWSFILHLLKPR